MLPALQDRVSPGATWDIWCRVIDNHGDLGVCWRLACALARRNLRLRLFVDDSSALAWMAPAGRAGVTVHAWPSEAEPMPIAGAVVIEAFGCDPPPAVVAQMSKRAQPPLWLNLEYLSAESYVERSHRLPSPQPGGLVKWFFYPGFTAQTGGLLREPDLLAERTLHDGCAWLAARGWARQPGETVISLFCYASAPMAALLRRLAGRPCLLLATPGHAQRLLNEAGPLPAGVRVQALPWLTQADYDRLLWSCDLNFVRGEDSLVRALWAGVPLVWHIYPQSDGAHAVKLQALLGLVTLPSPAGWPMDARAFIWAWNGLSGACELPPWPAPGAWREACEGWRATLAAQSDLASQLLDFAAGPPC